MDHYPESFNKKMSFSTVIYASEEASYSKLHQSLQQLGITQIHWCDSQKYSRVDMINQNLNQWLLFLDHDCGLTEENIKLLKDVTSKPAEKNKVWAGLYSNTAGATYLQRTHNFIANTWLLQSYEKNLQNKLVLGGAFLVFSTQKIPQHDKNIFWGAEDKLLSYQLASMNFQIELLKEFKVLHNTSRSVKHFARRAYLHGKNDIIHIADDKNKISYLFWIRKIGFVNLSLLPLIAFHFCIQRLAELIQRARHLSSIKK